MIKTAFALCLMGLLLLPPNLSHGEEAPGQVTAPLSADQMERLLQLARQALTLAVSGQKVDGEQLAATLSLPETLRQPSGAFVTLKKQGELRGCIGSLLPSQPLYQAVVNNARNAALRDSRFLPVQSGELPSLELEVSVISPMRPIASPEEFQVGQHGVVMSKQGRQAVFLPEVAIEQGWDRTQTLQQLSLKAGLPAEAWREGALFFVFTTQHQSTPY